MKDYTLNATEGSYVISSEASTLIFTPADGSAAVTLGLPATGAPVVEPGVTEVDIQFTDGTTGKFVAA